MALQLRCFLNGMQVSVPINIQELGLSLPRDATMHGIRFEASTLALQFIDDAFDYIMDQYNLYGLRANIICLVEQNCNDNENWEELVNGKLNMGQRKKHCGDYCSISLPIEQDSCEVLLSNKMDQQVDVDLAIGQDGMTVLPAYHSLGLDMEIPTKPLDYKTEGYVADEGDVEPSAFDAGSVGSAAFILVRPDFKNEVSANITDSSLTGASTIGISANDNLFIPITPEVLYNEPNIKCFGEVFKVNGRLKGTITLPNATGVAVNFMLKRGEINRQLIIDVENDVRNQYASSTVDNPVNYPFDWQFTEYDWMPIDNGSDGLYLMMALLVHGDATGNITFDKGSFFKAETLKSCPPTNSKVYLVHETLSRVVEAVTNYCVRVKSEYYGRRDSEPFDFDNDGCGGLRIFTSGLKLRNAANAKFFASPMDLIGNLQDIDNIGMAVENDPDIPGNLLLRIEDLDYFYRDVEILRCPAIEKIDESEDLSRSYSTIEVGYEKWQTQANFGLDEYNSTRQYRTSNDSITNKLTILSKLIAGEYAIELTRQQQYVDTSEADTTYDNDIFIICLKRISAIGYPYGEMVVEQGNVANPENIFSPSSILNYGISPIRNLLRWFRSIASTYPNITDTQNALFFNSGTGNFIAKGELAEFYGGTCRLEKDSIQENQNIGPFIFIDQNQATPLWKNNVIQYEYPLSLGDYKRIKANPYGYISYQCGATGEWKKAWIDDLEFKPFDGIATFKLREKWKQ